MEHIGRRASIRFDGDPGNPWFDGTVEQYITAGRFAGCHLVHFDDNERRKISIAEHEDDGASDD